MDFLPKLPKANLDDREYEDMMQECLLRIPRYCPEWTNYNSSDPGITMIELFAWLFHQMQRRFNQIPRRNYVMFMELLGVRLQAPQPAKTQVTFYLVSELPQAYTIVEGTQIATERTPNEVAVVFSTDKNLIIGHPIITHLLTATALQPTPQVLRDRFSNIWTLDRRGWSGPELSLFNDLPEEGNCFYIVLDPKQVLAGNVIAINFRGQAATPTGINPNNPPRRWEAWNGEAWEEILLKESDDNTNGFSFSEVGTGNQIEQADIILHLPLSFPVSHFTAYRGYWLRCSYQLQDPSQPPYRRSPRIVGVSARSIGGTVEASNNIVITDEVLGESDGTPGQSFQLQGTPVLDRRADEYVLVTGVGELPQRWTEVKDFGDSTSDDRHYVIDSLTGLLQFGPNVREPTQLKAETEYRLKLQQQSSIIVESATNLNRQYGAIPPKGAQIKMSRYRTGGGNQGNVQAGTLKVIKSAVPYISKVINYKSAQFGSDAETLEQAAIRVPKLLRNKNRAVTPEDFEILAVEGGQGAIARAHCLPNNTEKPGTVTLLIVPKANLDGIEQGIGVPPELFRLNRQLINDLVAPFIDERRLLGVNVEYSEPEYVGVSVQIEIALKPEYKNPSAIEQIIAQMTQKLYRFLNPITGGMDEEGWELGRPLYTSDIVALFQSMPSLRYVGAIQLVELRQKNNQNWERLPPSLMVNPGPLGVICSWENSRLLSAHVVNII